MRKEKESKQKKYYPSTYGHPKARPDRLHVVARMLMRQDFIHLPITQPVHLALFPMECF